MMATMELDAVQIRILGCLIEKQKTTPDNYPLSTNALVNACNQSSNRDPVVSYDQRTVDSTMLELRTEGLARTVTGGRANKHRHVLDEAWGLTDAEAAVLAVLFLRGPQTVGELRTRTERMHDFTDLEAVERTLGALAARPEPFVVHLERQPGQKERRWAHLLGVDDDAGSAGEAVPSPSAPTVHSGAPTTPALHQPAPATSARAGAAEGEVAELRSEVAKLRADVDRLYELLGESADDGR